MNQNHSTRTADGWTAAFFVLTGTGALVGQAWAGALHLPGHLDPIWAFLLMVPIVAVVEIGGVAMAARADLRRRLGESAYGYRILSAAVAIFAVVFNFVGHYEHNAPSWWSWLFSGLSALGYSVWLLLSGDRRRDALRHAGKLSTTAPVYGLIRWLRQPGVTRLARNLALEHGYGLFESLAAARQQVRDNTRRAALAQHLRALIRSRVNDPRLAEIAVTTYDLDVLADQVAAHADYTGWAQEIGAYLAPVPPVKAVVADKPAQRRRKPAVERVAMAVKRTPDASPAQIAARLGLTEGTVRRHRQKLPVFANPAPIAHANGHAN